MYQIPPASLLFQKLSHPQVTLRVILNVLIVLMWSTIDTKLLEEEQIDVKILSGS